MSDSNETGDQAIDQALRRRAGGTPSPAPIPEPATRAPDDAGSQALSDALRSSFAIVRLIMIGLVIAFIGSGIFTVGSQERAVILRFGRPVVGKDGQLLGPGLHWAYPYPIDEVVKITNALIQSVSSTVGWYGTTPEAELSGTEAPPGPSLNPAIDSYTLTGDGNIIHVRATLQYRIAEPLTYVFGFTNAAAVIQDALDNALVYASLQTTVDDALRRNVEGFREKIQARIAALIDEQELGITLEPLTLRTLAPRQLKEDFDKVQIAEQDLSRLMNEAQAYASTNRSAALGAAAALVNSGIAHSNQWVQAVAADAEKFQRLLPVYERNPGLFRQRLLIQTLQRVMTNAQDKYFIPVPIEGGATELRININREQLPPRPGTAGENR